MQEAERHGIADKVVVVVGSDFGRTPGYNDGNGKDHWSVTSMLFMGQGIQGGRVVGASSDGHRAFGVDDALNVIPDEESEQKINPAHVHSAFRNKFAQGAENPLAAMFPTSNERTLAIL